MPTLTTYPGVYIEEIPSGVHTITGVATSITAFLGRTLRGPTDSTGPVTINNYGDFERVFGGLWEFSPLSFAVRDFFQNGGNQAVIVRLFQPYTSDADQSEAIDAAQDVANAAGTAAGIAGAGPDDVATAARAEANLPANTAEPRFSAADAVASAAETAAAVAGADAAAVATAATNAVSVSAPTVLAGLTVDTLSLQAAYPGAWGNQLRARVDHDVLPASSTDLFNLTVQDGLSGTIETFRNVSVEPNHVRNLVRVLEQESALVRVKGALPATRPDNSAPDPLGVVPPGGNPFDDTNSSKVTTDAASDGADLDSDVYTGSLADKTGLYALERSDLVNILCIPPFSFGVDVTPAVIAQAAAYCEGRRSMLLIDPPESWNSVSAAIGDGVNTGVAALGTNSKNAAVFFPRLIQSNSEHDDQMESFVPCGAVAGVFARTDAQRGVWKAPAGLQATMVGVPQLSISLTDAENGQLNPLGINCLRALPAAGRVVWGARTSQGDDRLTSEWKYIPVRRTALYIEESLYRGTKWIVFEPNDEPLWAQIRLNIGAFMHTLFRQGAFQGTTPKEAYLVKCDSETTTQTDIDSGIVNILVGFAPLKPAEFVIIKIQQLAGQIET